MTQENLATDIKPIRATLEKWHPPRSAFSKLWAVFFLGKTSPCLNGIMLKIEINFFWKKLPGNGSNFLEINILFLEKWGQTILTYLIIFVYNLCCHENLSLDNVLQCLGNI